MDSAMNFLVPHLPKILVGIFIFVFLICEFVSFLQKRYQEEVSLPHIRNMLEGVAYTEVTFQPAQQISRNFFSSGPGTLQQSPVQPVPGPATGDFTLHLQGRCCLSWSSFQRVQC